VAHPILPFINDTEENVLSILKACADAGVKGIICFDMGLTLRDGDREYITRRWTGISPA
jgi:DNA repair photolyase